MGQLQPGDWTDVVFGSLTFVVILIAVLVAWRQLSAGVKTERVKLLRDLLNDIRHDPEAFEQFYNIEYGRFVFDSKFQGSASEKGVDRLLHKLDLVCDLHFQGMITTKEMKFFDYYLRRVGSNDQIGLYFAWLRKWYLRAGTTTHPFSAFRRYVGLP